MPEKIEELVRAALAAAQEAGDLSAFELDDCAIERPAVSYTHLRAHET